MSENPDLDLARRFLAANAPEGRPLLCAITGSHHYGFSSPDSDLDIKGIHLAPTRGFLSFAGVRDVVDTIQMYEGVECDLTSNEVAKALKLLLSGNGNMLERIQSPFQLLDGPEVTQLKALAEGAITTRFHRHYAGFFQGMCREHEKSTNPTAKTLLYAYRVALTGTHLLRTGELQANLRVLAPQYGFDEALDLIAFKAATQEKAVVTPEDDALHRANWPKLAATLGRALDESTLPDAPANLPDVETWLIDLRIDELAG